MHMGVLDDDFIIIVINKVKMQHRRESQTDNRSDGEDEE